MAEEYMLRRSQPRANPVAADGISSPEADALILERYSPAALVVDGRGKILEFRGASKQYLDGSGASSSPNLWKVAGEELAADLRAIIGQAKQRNAAARSKGVRNGRNQRVDVEVVPFHDQVTKERRYLVLFEHVPAGMGVQGAAQRAETAVEDSPQNMDASRAELRKLAGALITAQEEERRRVSREIHDEVNQEFTLLELEVEKLQQDLPSSVAEIQSRLEALRGKVAELSDNLRRLAYRLHPSVLDDLGLTVALRSLCKDFSEWQEIRVNFAADELQSPLPEVASTCLYRVCQEALRNVARHANAKNVIVRLTVSDSGILLTVRDDGEGFEPEKLKRRGLGMLSMQERALLAGGKLTIDSELGKGTRIELRVPAPGVST